MSETNLSEDEVKSVDSNISSGEWDTYHENPSFIEPPSGEDLVDPMRMSTFVVPLMTANQELIGHKFTATPPVSLHLLLG